MPDSELLTPTLIDTHCHIHESGYTLDRELVLKRADEAGVKKILCVGTKQVSSDDAVSFAAKYGGVYAAVGVHPHDAKDGWGLIGDLAGADASQGNSKLVAIGEIGLDYYYSHSPRHVQLEALQAQIEIAIRHDLPVIFHVRDAYDDFWPIFDSFKGVRGVLHSFTDTQANLEEGLKRGLFIGVNGISTFTKDEARKAMYNTIPLNRLLLETDSPYLTPVPFRGRVNEPAYVSEVAKHQANARGIPFGDIAASTTANAEALFALR